MINNLLQENLYRLLTNLQTSITRQYFIKICFNQFMSLFE